MNNPTQPADCTLPGDPGSLAASVAKIWAEAFESVFESMTAHRPTVALHPLPIGSPLPEGYVWRGQGVSLVPAPALWIGAPALSWNGLGQLTLAALGVNDAADSDIQSTCQDLLAQTTSLLTQRLTEELGLEVSSRQVSPSSEPSGAFPAGFTFSIDAGLATLEGAAFLDGSFLERICQLVQAANGAPASATSPADPAAAQFVLPAHLPRMQIRVRFLLGRATLPLQDVFNLTVGSVIELDRSVTDLADIMTGDHRLARGEIVVIEGNYGIKVTDKPEAERQRNVS